MSYSESFFADTDCQSLAFHFWECPTMEKMGTITAITIAKTVQLGSKPPTPASFAANDTAASRNAPSPPNTRTTIVLT